MLLAARSISKVYGLRTLFRGVSLSIDEGERIGLIGPNGAGKSTLLKVLAGQEQPDDGELIITKGLRAAYVAQLDTFPERLADAHNDHAPAQKREHDAPTAREIVALGAMRAPQVHDRYEADVVADIILGKIGFDDAHAAAPAAALSGGWRKRLSIARSLASLGGEPDLLLLDEPTNHLDLEGIAWLESLLKKPLAGGGRGFASIFVTHDRAFLEGVATRVVELSRAYPDGTLAVDGNYTEFLRRKEEFLTSQSRAEQSLANQVRKDLAWLARGPQARRTKSKSRIESSHGRIDELGELKARNAAASAGGARIDFTGTGRKTRKMLAARGIAKSIGDKRLFAGVDIELGAGDCLGLVGPNGSGKTTLIRVLTGDLAPDEGEVRLAEPRPRVVVFSQHRRDFPPTMLLRDALSPVDQVRMPGEGGGAMHITAWSRRFLFRDEQLAQQMQDLSGGELARVHIARMMLEPADILVLDEPTNDLDIPTLEVLEETLEEFAGALILVTHDRAMLGRLATEVLLLDGRGNATPHTDLDQALAAAARTEEPASSPQSKDPRAAASPAESAPASPAPSQTKKKLSYNEQREYDGLEAKILDAESRAAELEARLGDPEVVNDHARMARACRELEEAQARVAALYARWEELEAKLR